MHTAGKQPTNEMHAGICYCKAMGPASMLRVLRALAAAHPLTVNSPRRVPVRPPCASGSRRRRRSCRPRALHTRGRRRCTLGRPRLLGRPGLLGRLGRGRPGRSGAPLGHEGLAAGQDPAGQRPRRACPAAGTAFTGRGGFCGPGPRPSGRVLGGPVASSPQAWVAHGPQVPARVSTAESLSRRSIGDMASLQEVPGASRAEGHALACRSITVGTHSDLRRSGRIIQRRGRRACGRHIRAHAEEAGREERRDAVLAHAAAHRHHRRAKVHRAARPGGHGRWVDLRGGASRVGHCALCDVCATAAHAQLHNRGADHIRGRKSSVIVLAMHGGCVCCRGLNDLAAQHVHGVQGRHCRRQPRVGDNLRQRPACMRARATRPAGAWRAARLQRRGQRRVVQEDLVHLRARAGQAVSGAHGRAACRAGAARALNKGSSLPLRMHAQELKCVHHRGAARSDAVHALRLKAGRSRLEVGAIEGEAPAHRRPARHQQGQPQHRHSRPRAAAAAAAAARGLFSCHKRAGRRWRHGSALDHAAGAGAGMGLHAAAAASFRQRIRSC